MDRSKSVVTPERYKSGRTFEQYLAFIGTPENLKREGTGGGTRPDHTAVMREWYEGSRLSDTQAAVWKWLAAQPGGPAKIRGCRRMVVGLPARVPMLARGRGGPAWSFASSTATARHSARAADPWRSRGGGRTRTSWRSS